MSRIEELNAIIEQSIVERDTLRKACKHPHLLVVGRPDLNCGWGQTTTCNKCGEFFGYLTRQRNQGEEPYAKVIRRTTQMPCPSVL